MANETITTIDKQKVEASYDEAFKKALDEVIDYVTTPTEDDSKDSDEHQSEVSGLCLCSELFR